ncbi:MAG: hypothetical protein K2G99_05735 [Desulfovibrio sp.]|nr:hypothetical protein [Desulfovibrio sp.]
MEINAEQLDALLRVQEQQAQGTRKTAGQPGVFDALLTQQLAGQDAGTTAQAGPLPPGAQAALYSQILLNGVGASEATDPDTAVFQAAFDQASGTLDLWDTYAKTLGSSPTNSSLREAYALLEGIDSEVTRLRQDTAGVRGKNPGLDSLLNELEVLTATEKFKFNRGDYLM